MENNEYQSSGKKYNGEKAIISLTSWKARINTVSKTLYSLFQQCLGFHIVLVLSEEEFPQKEKELPENLILFVKNNLIELLWVYKNYKSFKKVLFTMDKYRDVPVISADDDCIYNRNYAKELYDAWLKNKDCIITNYTQFLTGKFKYKWTQGPNTLYSPNCFKEYGISNLDNVDFTTSYDDFYYASLIFKLKLNVKYLNVKQFFKFHDNVFGISDNKKPNIIEEIEKNIKGLII